MVWDKARIKRRLRELDRLNQPLSYNLMCQQCQALVSAAAYHYGSYRTAIEQAGLTYTQIRLRPRWNKARIIQVLQAAARRGENLNWSAVTRRGDELSRAAFAALQPRLFKTWDKALLAAGLDRKQVSLYRRWTPKRVVRQLKDLHRTGRPVNSGALQRTHPGLHAAAVRHFDKFDMALQAAKLSPEMIRRRRVWSTCGVQAALRRRSSGDQPLGTADLRKADPSLYKAAMRLFGSLAAARKAVKKAAY